MSGTLAPVLKHRFFDADGAPLAGGKLYSYEAGTSTPQATYTDASLATANANPVVLDANGEASVWLDPALSYKFVLDDSDDVEQWSVDNVAGNLNPASLITAGLVELTSPESDDTLRITDTSAGIDKEITLENFLKVINDLTDKSVPLIADKIALHDAAGAAAKSATLDNLFKAINGLTADTAPRGVDTVVTYDSSASAPRKVAISSILMELMKVGDTINIEFGLSGGVFSIQGHGGAALSPDNPAYICLRDKTNPERRRIYTVTANQTFKDAGHASSQITGNLFGTTTGVAWSQDVPFFIYGVANDAEDTCQFMTSRNPTATTSPAESEIGAADDAAADSESSFFALSSALTEADYESNPCACIGAIRMRKTAGDDWQVQTLNAKDGVGRYHENTQFTMPTGQNGAGSGSHFLTNGGTIPVFSGSVVTYFLRRDGEVRVQVKCSGDGGTDGSGAVNTRLALPLKTVDASTSFDHMGSLFYVATPGFILFHTTRTDSGEQTVSFADESNNPLQHGDFTNGVRHIEGSLTYRAFG